jgi:hypothetical protein
VARQLVGEGDVRRFPLAAFLVISLLVAMPASVPAQGDFPLKSVDAKFGDPLLMMSQTTAQRLPQQPKEIKALPKDASGKLTFFRIPFGGKEVLAVIVPGKPSKLYIDSAGTGDLSAATPLSASGEGPQQQFGPTVIVSAGRQAPKLQFMAFGNGQLLMVLPAGYYAGEATLGGQTYRVATVASVKTGRYDVVADPAQLRFGERDYSTLAIDLDRSGEFSRDVLGDGEIVPLGKFIKVKDVYYSVKVAADGSSVHFEKAEPKTGTLDAGTPDAELVVLGEAGFQNLSGAGGKWQLPVGKYTTLAVKLTKKDAAGTPWTIEAQSEVGKLATFEIRPGETMAVKCGAPLVAHTEATKAGDNQMSIGLALTGQGGEQYSPAAVQKGQPQTAPKFKILDEAGKVLATGQFEFG